MRRSHLTKCVPEPLLPWNQQELLAPDDSALERLLVDRVLACWLQIAHADVEQAHSLDPGRPNVRAGGPLQDRQDRAHARFVKAVKTLATVRRLLVPSVQVNIGKNQIISQGGPGVATQEPNG